MGVSGELGHLIVAPEPDQILFGCQQNEAFAIGVLAQRARV
jgi:hypothetical protein